MTKKTEGVGFSEYSLISAQSNMDGYMERVYFQWQKNETRQSLGREDSC